MRFVEFLNTLRQDAHYALRLLVKAPGFTIIAVLTLALGIGANTAIFSLMDAVMFRALPVEDPQRLVLLQWNANKAPEFRMYMVTGDTQFTRMRDAPTPTGNSFSYPFLEQVQKSDVFAGVAAFAGGGSLTLTGNGSATTISSQLVSGEFFHTLGVHAAAGRLLEPGDDQPSSEPAVVLNYGYWQRAFGGSPSAIGKVVNLNGIAFTVVGVAEKKFISLSLGNVFDAWIPIAMANRLNPMFAHRNQDAAAWWVLIAARLEPGATAEQAQAALDVLFKNSVLHGEKPVSKEADAPHITLPRAQDALIGASAEYKDPLRVLTVVVAIVLLIACANIAGLVVSRATGRRREIAVRLALGARRTRLLRQLLTESMVLGIFGGALGILLALGGTHTIVSMVAGGQTRPLGFSATLDWRVLAFTGAVSVLTGILFGLAPALRSLRLDLTPALKGGSGASIAGKPETRHRWFSLSNALVVIQTSLAIVVLMGAGLLVRTLTNLKDLNPGFDTRNTLTFSLNPRPAGYKPPQIDNLYRELQGQIGGLPGVMAVSYSQMALLSGGWSRIVFDYRPPGSAKKVQVEADDMPVGPDFFNTVKIPLVAGRALNSADYERAAKNRDPFAPPDTSPAPPNTPLPVVVNQAFARKYFPGVNPIGQTFGENDGSDPKDPEKDPGNVIVGVVQDAKYDDLRRAIDPTMYVPLSGRSATFEVRTAGDPTAMVPAIRNLIGQHDANLPLNNVMTQSEQIDQLLQQERLIAKLSSFFGVLALLLACVGLYGLLSYEVTRRTCEIGIRMALGAQRADLVRLVVLRGFALALTGTAIGIAAAFGVGRLLSTLLFGVKAGDPITMVVVTLLLVVVAMLAAFVPARRATTVDPMIALRYE
jgi:predicted permease